MSRRDDATRESKNTRIAILGLTKYRMTGSFLTFHPIIYDHKDYNVDLNSDIPGVITRIRPPILLCRMVTRLQTCHLPFCDSRSLRY